MPDAVQGRRPARAPRRRRFAPALALVLALGPTLAPLASPARATPPPKRLSAPCLAPRTDAPGGERLLLPGVQALRPAGVPAPPPIRAAAWIVADLDTGAVVASSSGHVRCAPASTLKILTAISLAPSLDPATVYTATPADANIDGSKVGVVAGSQYTVADLLHGLMLGSGNDTASALGALAGGQPRATDLMRDEAARLGAGDTVVANTSGLDAEGQVSSPYDLALFARQALRTPQVAALASTKIYNFPDKGRVADPARKHFQIANHNKLLWNYRGALGVKNGYTVAAGGSFVGAARRGSHTYVAALIHADGVTWVMARQLLDWAFANGPRVQPIGRLVEPGELTSPSPAPSASQAPGAGEALPVTTALTATDGGVGLPWVVLTLVAALGAGAGLGWYRHLRPERAAPEE